MTPESDEQREQGARDVEKWQREELAREQGRCVIPVAPPKRGLLERFEDWIRGRLK